MQGVWLAILIFWVRDILLLGNKYEPWGTGHGGENAA